MSDVAQLGLAVDSGQVTSATTALNQFSGAANTAATSADKLNLGNGKLGPSMSAVESMAKRAGVSVEEMSARIKAASTSYDQAASSQNKYVAITQQAQAVNAKSAQAANDNSTAIAGIGTASEASRTSMDRFTASLTRAFIAGGVAIAIRAISQYVWNLNAALAATAIAAEQASVSYQKFQGLQNAASNRGVTNDDFNTAMVSFNRQVELAKAGLGDLRGTLALNGKTVSDTATTFGVVADLVKNARTEIERENILQAAGLPTSAQFVRYMQQGSQAIRDQADASQKLSDDMLENAKRINDAWNEMWTNFAQTGKKVTIEVFDGLKSAMNSFNTFVTNALQAIGVNVAKNLLKDAMTGGGTVQSSQLNANSNVSGFYSGLGTGAPGNAEQANQQQTKTIQQTRELIGLEQQRIGILGQTATVQQQVKAVELQIAQARLAGVNITKAESDNLLRLAQSQALGTFQINAQTDAEKVRLATLGMSSEAGIAYEIVQTKINEALARGAPLTKDQITQLQAAAANYASVKVQADLVRQAIDISSTAASSVFKNIAEGVAPMKAFADAAKSAAESIIDIATRKITENLLGGLLGDSASQTAGATSAATILTTAGTTVAASIVAGATEAATILGVTIPPAAATLPVAGAATGVEVAAGGAAAGASLAVGGAAAGAAIWGPIAILAAAIAALGTLSFLGGGSSKKNELKQAQDNWEKMADQVTAFNHAAAGFDLGPLTQQVQQLYQTQLTLASAAKQAKDYAGLANIQHTFNEGVVRTVGEFANGAVTMTDLEKSIKAVNNEALGLTETLHNYKIMDRDQEIEQGRLAQIAKLTADFISSTVDSLTADINTASGKGYLNDIAADVKKYNDLLSQGIDKDLLSKWLSTQTQRIVDDSGVAGSALQELIAIFPQLAGIVHAATQAIADAQASMIADIRSNSGLGYLNTLGDALTKFNGAIAQGVNEGVATAWLTSVGQAAVDSAKLTGQAFQDMLAEFPQLTGKIHEFVDTVGLAAKAAADATEKLNLQLRLLSATTDTSTQAGALTLFDAKAKQERDAAIAGGISPENLLLLDQALAAERLGVIKTFTDQAVAAEKQLADARLAQMQRIQQYLDNLRGGSSSTLSPSDRLAAAQSQFNSQLSLAQGGDANALSNITSYSDNLLQAARAYYASSVGYQNIFASVQAALGGLIGGGISSSIATSGLPTSSISSATLGISTAPVSTPTAANSNSSLIARIDALQAALVAAIGTNTQAVAIAHTEEKAVLQSIESELSDGNGMANLAASAPKAA